MVWVEKVSDADVIVKLLDVVRCEPENAIVVQSTGQAILELVADPVDDG